MHFFNKNLAVVEEQPMVLVVDSNGDNLEIVAFLLTLYGCAVMTATNVKTALQLVSAHQPALILLELILPELDGISMVQHLRQNGHKIPIIATTTLTGEIFYDRALAAGCNEYIEKPYHIEKLESLVKRYVHGLNQFTRTAA